MKDSSRTIEASMGGIAVPALAAAIWIFICRLPSMRRSEWLMSPLRDIVLNKKGCFFFFLEPGRKRVLGSIESKGLAKSLEYNASLIQNTYRFLRPESYDIQRRGVIQSGKD